MSQPADAVAFPELTHDEMQCIGSMGLVRKFTDGEELFASGDHEVSLFVIQSGGVAIIDRTSGSPRDVVVHGPREFTGDVSMLTGRPTVVSAEARGGCEAIEITACQIRRILGEIPTLSDKFLEAFQLRRQQLEDSEFMGLRVVGRSDSKETLELREFFYKNKVPYTFHDITESDGEQALTEFGASEDDMPVIACNANVVKRPTLPEVAECLGISRAIKGELYDVLIVGAGPAGLAAAVYGASEGLKTLVVDRVGPGGQAGQSSKIENYMGFPAGLPGTELANRGFLQAMKFGAEFNAPVSVHSMTCNQQGEHEVELCTGQIVRTKSVLIATGASYRRLPIKDCQRLEGAGVYYSATSVEARVCHNATALVVGGGNSAGQAAMYLSQHAREVKLLLRGNDLRKSMSDYLAKRIESTKNIEVMTETEVEGLRGDERLQQVTLKQIGGPDVEIDCAGLFVFVGAQPHTEWLPDSVARDARGFVLTGPSMAEQKHWTLDRPPCELETTCPGVFAAGDVRSGTTKRCAFAVGDGALAITCVHQFLSSEA